MKTQNKNESISSYCFREYAACYLRRTGPVAFSLFFLLSSFFSFAQDNSLKGFNTVSPDVKENVMSTLRKSSKKFQLISNDGQMGLPRNVIAYFSTGSQMVFIEKDRLRIIVQDRINKQKESKSFAVKKDVDLLPGKYWYNSFCIKFKGSNGFSGYETGKPFDIRRNFIDKSSVTNVLSYEDITLKNVYDGIDLRLYSQESGQLEFDWIVWPDADPDMIRMLFEGQKKLSINSDGDLEVNLAMGRFNMHMPESYYSTPKGKINAEYQFRLSGKNEVSFKQHKKRDNQYALVIDPDLLWGTFFDGASSTFDEYLYAIEFNNSNQMLYCAGVANQQVSTAYVAALTSGYNGTFVSNQDVIVYALSKNGAVINYCTYLGGTSNDVATGISINGSKIFVCGHTSSSNFPVTNGSGGTTAAFDNSFGGNKDGFVAVFNEALDQLNYCTYLGGTSNDVALTIRAVGSNSFYVSLDLDGSLPASPTNYFVNYADNNFGGAEEAWIGEFSSFNIMDFGTYIGGTDIDMINDFQLLSDGDVVFTGTTAQITEVNGTVANDATNSDVLFGRIDVSASGPVSFSILEKIGGSGTDNGYGILTIGDSVSIIVGQTNSNDFPIGAGTPFQGAAGGNYDGFVARIYNDGSGGYQASYVGGSDMDILVCVRPVVLDHQILLLCFGTTASTDLAVNNFNAGTLYSSTNSSPNAGTGSGSSDRYDMMFLICNMNFSTKYYLSYIGGDKNDYLGATGVPIGSNHLYYNATDSVLYLGTTTHSNQATQQPKFVGRGLVDFANSGVPVFDSTKNNGNNDTHLILAISTTAIYKILDVQWQSFGTMLNSDCSVQLQWEVTNENSTVNYTIERSLDGRNFESGGVVSSGYQQYSYNDPIASGLNGTVYYRIRSTDKNNNFSYSKTNVVRLCGSTQRSFKIYPTVTRSQVNIEESNLVNSKNIILQMFNTRGALVLEKKMTLSNGPTSLSVDNISATGSYFLMIKDIMNGSLLYQQKIIIVRN